MIDWTKGRTGNTLLKKHIFAAGEEHFGRRLRAGSDQDFFRRMIAKGHVFIWCDEAVVYEVEPPPRWKRTFILRKALMRGATSVLLPTFGASEITKSVVAVPVYTALLPLALLLGQHRFMGLLVKLFGHLGVVCACLGVDPIREEYVTD